MSLSEEFTELYTTEKTKLNFNIKIYDNGAISKHSPSQNNENSDQIKID